jgi:hypothetical protein
MGQCEDSQAMSRASKQQFDLFATWFENNLGRYPIVDQEQRWQFTVKCIQNMALVIATMIEERSEQSPQLYLPSGLRYTGDLTKVG